MKRLITLVGTIYLICSCSGNNDVKTNELSVDSTKSLDTICNPIKANDSIDIAKINPIDTVKINPRDTIDLASRYPWRLTRNYSKAEKQSISYSKKNALKEPGCFDVSYKRIRTMDCGIQVSIRNDIYGYEDGGEWYGEFHTESICFRKDKKSSWYVMLFGEGGQDCTLGFNIKGNIVYLIYADNSNEDWTIKYAQYDVLKHELLPLSQTEGRKNFPSGDICDYNN